MLGYIYLYFILSESDRTPKILLQAIAIEQKLITKSLKRRISVHAHHREFVQCVSPNLLLIKMI
ncbi:MAG: hypothetical protein HEQ25_23490 [Dolichospermum sp. DET73]|nr:hypothetical protein [Dolichospermum sp. DET73]